MLHDGIMRIRRDSEAEEVFEINLTVDFSSATPAQLAEWAFANRKIAVQNVLRANWSPEAIAEHVANGLTVMAVDASKKPQSKAELVATIKAMLASGTISKEDLE